MADDNVQHGIDDNPHDDGKKGLELGALGGGAVGAMAGMAAGPVGAIVGALIGGTVGSLASGAAVDAVDAVDNDNTVSGIGDGATTKDSLTGANTAGYQAAATTPTDYTTTNTSGSDATTLGQMPATGATMMNDQMNTPPYGTYEGRDISRTEYDQMNETDRMKVQLMAENLNVSKEMRQAGEVTVSKHVVEEQVSVPVTLQHEEVTITRRDVNTPVDASMADNVFQDQTIKVPVHEEVARVTKEAHVAEEIEINKRTVGEERTVSDTVRHEELDVNTPQGVQVQGGTTGTSGTGTM